MSEISDSACTKRASLSSNMLAAPLAASENAQKVMSDGARLKDRSNVQNFQPFNHNSQYKLSATQVAPIWRIFAQNDQPKGLQGCPNVSGWAEITPSNPTFNFCALIERAIEERCPGIFLRMPIQIQLCC